MSKTKLQGGIPPTLSEKSSWTPKNYLPTNEKIFQERMTLIKKWYRGWSEDQRWCLMEYILQQMSDNQLLLIHSLLEPTFPPPDQDFTRVLPRWLCLYLFSMLDPQSLCRAAQVCWYWKYLTECNEIWREKCLRLGWFLPSPPPPYMHDHTLWKRHYIACVCQLHWNPPQRPEEGQAEDAEDNADGLLDKDEQREKRKRRRKPAHMVGEEEGRRPWRNPDPRPTDTHYSYRESPYLPLYSRFPSVRSQQSTRHFSSSSAPTPLPTTTTPLLPPPSALLHPTLMEKLRLGSPTLAHTNLSTLNKYQMENEINQTFYELQDTSPFPKLPVYYVHPATPTNTGVLESNSTGGVQKAPRFRGRETTPRGRSFSGPPTTSASERINTGSNDLDSARSSRKVSISESVNEGSVKDSQRQVGVVRKGEELLTRAWHIPEDEDT